MDFARRALALIVVAIVFLAPVVPITPASAQKVPADMTLEGGKDSPGPVVFSHTEHKEKGVEKCQACHTKVFKMKKGQTGPLTMAKMKAGEQCGACHNGKTEIGGKAVFSTEEKANCEKCHKKK